MTKIQSLFEQLARIGTDVKRSLEPAEKEYALLFDLAKAALAANRAGVLTELQHAGKIDDLINAIEKIDSAKAVE